MASVQSQQSRDRREAKRTGKRRYRWAEIIALALAVSLMLLKITFAVIDILIDPKGYYIPEGYRDSSGEWRLILGLSIIAEIMVSTVGCAILFNAKLNFALKCVALIATPLLVFQVGKFLVDTIFLE